MAKNVSSIVHNRRFLENDVIRYNKTQMKPSGSTSRRDKELKDFNMNFGNSEDKFLDLDNGCENHIVIIRKFDINRISMISLRTRFRIIFIS